MKTKKATISMIVISALMLIVVVSLSVAFAKKQAGVEVPKIVTTAANEWVEQQFANINDDNYLDWRVESLEYAYTYEDFEGMTLQVYRMNYEYLVDNPDEIFLAGGMSIDEEGWLVPEYPNCTYLIFEQEGNELIYLTTIMHNDGDPGTEIFTWDLQNALGYEKGK